MLLSQTLLRQPMLTSTIVIPPKGLNIVSSKAEHLSGSVSIAGGMGNGLRLSLVSL
jgi:hypothetical protein